MVIRNTKKGGGKMKEITIKGLGFNCQIEVDETKNVKEQIVDYLKTILGDWISDSDIVRENDDTFRITKTVGEKGVNKKIINEIFKKIDILKQLDKAREPEFPYIDYQNLINLVSQNIDDEDASTEAEKDFI